jgi:hypothetical protein
MRDDGDYYYEEEPESEEDLSYVWRIEYIEVLIRVMASRVKNVDHFLSYIEHMILSYQDD